MSGCVCSTGFALKNGECVPKADCSSQDKSLETESVRITEFGINRYYH